VQLQRHGFDQQRRAAGTMSVVVVHTLAFMIVRQLLGLVRLGPSPEAKDVEIAAQARCRDLRDLGALDSAPATARAGAAAWWADVAEVPARPGGWDAGV